MTPGERLRAYLPRLAGPRGLMIVAVSLLFVLMSWSFLVGPWDVPACGGSLCDIPVASESNPNGSLSGSLFGGYAILVLVIALVLASCMIGGVYLAKTEGGPRP